MTQSMNRVINQFIGLNQHTHRVSITGHADYFKIVFVDHCCADVYIYDEWEYYNDHLMDLIRTHGVNFTIFAYRMYQGNRLMAKLVSRKLGNQSVMTQFDQSNQPVYTDTL